MTPPLRSFQHIAPPLRLFSGPESLDHLARELDRGKVNRAVIFCGGSLAREATLLHRVKAAIGERCAGVFEAVHAHSPLASVQDAARELQRCNADAVVPIGGGSAIVTARAASILLAEQGDVESLCTTRDGAGLLRSPKLNAAKLPQFVVPTTPTTAIVKAGSAVFDPETGRRFALYDPKTRAKAVFIHPDLVASAPRSLITSASLNTLSLAMEGLMSRASESLADALLMHALRLVRTHLPGDVVGSNPVPRCELVLAAILCGQGTDFAGAGVTTVLGHAISARHHLENGVVNAILLPHVLRFNAQDASCGLARIAASLDMPGPTGDMLTGKLMQFVQSFVQSLGAPGTLRALGVPRDDLPDIATRAMGDWFLRGNPRQVREAAELLHLLESAW